MPKYHCHKHMESDDYPGVLIHVVTPLNEPHTEPTMLLVQGARNVAFEAIRKEFEAAHYTVKRLLPTEIPTVVHSTPG